MVATIVVAAALIILGGLSAIFGYALFRLVLPIIGFLTGMVMGWTGAQAVFGVNAFSLLTGTILALVLGLVVAALAYSFYSLAIVILGVIIGGNAMAFIAITLGLQEDGFLTLLLAIAGAIIVGMAVYHARLERNVAMLVTSFVGVSLFFTGVLLIFSDLSLSEVHETGALAVARDFVSQHFVWFMAWLGGGMAFYTVQYMSVSQMEEMFGGQFALEEVN